MRKFINIKQRKLNRMSSKYGNTVDKQAADNSSEFHWICQNQESSIETLQEVLERDPCLASQMNSAGQTPLHVAAEAGLSPKVVDILLQCYPEAASIQDCKGKTPLHYACASTQAPKLEVVQILCNASPQSVTVEDSNGMSALEYAIVGLAPSCIVKALHRASQNHWCKTKNQLLVSSCPTTSQGKSDPSSTNRLMAKAA